METGLVTKDNKLISMPYYEIGAFAENICKIYIDESPENKIQFDSFANDYHFFKPYLDFLLFKLGYKMINPLLRENSVWQVENNVLNLRTSLQKFEYLPVSDDALGIRNIDPENMTECVVDFYGKVYEISRNSNIHHEDIYELILNQYLIYDEELFKIYENYMNLGLNVGAFCRNMLGFYQIAIYPDSSGFVAYCNDFYNSYMDNICKRITAVNPKIEIACDHIHTEESLALANKCIERVGEINENRRLRF